MRFVAAILIAFVIFPSATFAGNYEWTGAGWYVIADPEVGLGGVLMLGPFADEAACNANRPQDDNFLSYFCEYHAQKPS